MNTKLPLQLRGEGRYRKIQLGVDVPTWFFEGIKALDSQLYFIWHPFKTLYEDIMNQYSGKTEEARYTIGTHYKFGNELIFGFVLTDGKGKPAPENKWHVWRLCSDRGWAHVAALETTSDEDYLKFVLNQMYMRDKVLCKYGPKGLSRYLKEEQEQFEEAKKKEHNNIFQDLNKENNWLFKKAYENFLNGKVHSTDTTKDVITSYSGQTNRSRITRELTDKEGGLITLDD